jgi:hypothetical protein
MSDIDKRPETKPEQSADAKQPIEQRFDDLPVTEITQQDAQAVKGGAGVSIEYKPQKPDGSV